MGRSPHEGGATSKAGLSYGFGVDEQQHPEDGARTARGLDPERKSGIEPMASFRNHPRHRAASRAPLSPCPRIC